MTKKNYADDPVRIDFDDLGYQTEGAYMLIVEGEKVWIPKAEVIDGMGPEDIDGHCWVTHSIAKHKGLI